MIHTDRHIAQTENKGTDKQNSGLMNFPGVDIMTSHATTAFLLSGNIGYVPKAPTRGNSLKIADFCRYPILSMHANFHFRPYI